MSARIAKVDSGIPQITTSSENLSHSDHLKVLSIYYINNIYFEGTNYFYFYNIKLLKN